MDVLTHALEDNLRLFSDGVILILVVRTQNS